MYELKIVELTPFSDEEKEKAERNRDPYTQDRGFSDELYHEKRVVFVSLTEEEMQAIKKAVVEVM